MNLCGGRWLHFLTVGVYNLYNFKSAFIFITFITLIHLLIVLFIVKLHTTVNMLTKELKVEFKRLKFVKLMHIFHDKAKINFCITG